MTGCFCTRVLRCQAILLAAVSLAAIGCGDDTDRLPLSGKVNWHGRPLEKGSILFVPTAGHRGPKIGAPIVDGGYKIEAQRGATPGTYRVEVQSDTGEYPHSPTDARPRTAAGKTRNTQSPLPKEYNSESHLTALVSAENTTFNFDLPLSN